MLVVRGDINNDDNMFFLQVMDYGYVGHVPYKCGIEMICGSFRCIGASELAGVALLTKSRKFWSTKNKENQ